MSKAIIVEGPDASGKTTLCKTLKSHGYRYEHCVPSLTNPRTNLLRFYTDAIWRAAHSKRPYVLDRGPLSEQVYGPIMRNFDRLGEAGSRLLTRLTRALGVGEVIALPPWRVVRSQWLEKKKQAWDPAKDEGDYLDLIEQLRRVYFKYRELLQSRPEALRYDWTSSASKFQEVLMMAADFKALPRTCIGSPVAEVLFVGEQVTHKKTATDLPFYSLTGSSRYLMDAMIAAWVDEEKIALVNAVPVHGEVKDLVKIIDHIGTVKRVIALGRVASRTLTSQGIKHVMIPHPKYEKRFKKGNLDRYVDLLREVTVL